MTVTRKKLLKFAKILEETNKKYDKTLAKNKELRKEIGESDETIFKRKGS